MFKGDRNTNGRPKGSKNRVSGQVKEAIAEILENNTQELQDRMANLSDDSFIKFYIQLAKFIVPQQRAILEQSYIEEEQPIFSIEVINTDIDEYKEREAKRLREKEVK